MGYDVIMDFPGKFADFFHKEKLHQINVSFVVDKLERQLGGTATNIAYNLSFLTKKPINVLAAVGKDGNALVNFLKKRKIKTNEIFQDKFLYSSAGQVITDVKDNQIWGYYYGASKGAGKIKIKNSLKNNSLLVISANHPEGFLNFQKQAIKKKIDYLYDPGMSLSWIKDEDLLGGIKNCTWLVGNDYEISMIQKRLNLSINQLIEWSVNVITTLGEEGVLYQSKVGKSTKSIKLKAYKVKKVVDPTGAGDAWRAGFLAGILNGKNIVDCLKLGNVMASFAVEKYGTVNHKPSAKEINNRLNKLKI